MDGTNDVELSSDRNEIYNVDEVYQIDKEIEKTKSELSECKAEYTRTEIELQRVNRLKNEEAYSLQSAKRRYNELTKEFTKIHQNYVKCTRIVNSNDELNSLMMERENLKKELEESKRIADKNNEKLIEMKRMITVQEKKNMALVRRLKKAAEKVHLTSDLKVKINKIIDDATNN